MKKGLIFLLCALLFAAAAVGGLGFFTWQKVDESAISRPWARALDTPLTSFSCQWHQPVFGGLLYKDLTLQGPAPQDLGNLEVGRPLTVTVPPDTAATLTVWQGEDQLESLSLPDALEWVPAAEGAYRMEVTFTVPQTAKEGYGSVSYSAVFTAVPPPQPETPPRPTEPTLLTGKTQLQQGDVLSLQLLGLPQGVVPAAETDLGMAVLTPYGELGDWFCAVPIGNTRKTGEYNVQITAGDGLFWNVPVTVEPFDFVEQDLTIDITDPVIGEANSPAAYQQYREKIPPLFATYDEARYWEGVFISPAEGRISTEFGTIRYTNGDRQNPSVHWGMDIANAEGTPIVAPAAGCVVLAEKLLNTGNTLVIEHGGGLKSYYFHMSELTVAQGDIVAQGQGVGAIGTTGYSTGPHLHFEVRIGNQAINPQMLFNESGGLYSASAALDG